MQNEVNTLKRVEMKLSLQKEAVSWDVIQCRYCNNRCFGGTCLLHLPSENNQRTRINVSSDCQDRSVLQFLLCANLVASFLIIFTLQMEAIRSSEMAQGLHNTCRLTGNTPITQKAGQMFRGSRTNCRAVGDSILPDR
jgi:hypothetical protein